MNYKLILFRDGRSILCSDEEIKVANWVIEYQKEDNIGEIFFIDTEYKIAKDIQKRIIAGIPSLPSITMSAEIRQKLFELHGWIDVEELCPCSGEDFRVEWIKGFNKNQELRGFSLRDMEKAIELTIADCNKLQKESYGDLEVDVTKITKSLQQPIEVKVELEMVEHKNKQTGEVFKVAAITNNSVTITKIL
jgi:hypothetical protein